MSGALGKAVSIVAGQGLYSKLGIDGGDFSDIVARTTIAAIIGGTVSKLSGGNFANGARTAAMQHLFNHEATKESNVDEFIFNEEDSREIIEFFFKGKLEGVTNLGIDARVLATDMYKLAWQAQFDSADIKELMINPLSRAAIGDAASGATKVSFSLSKEIFKFKLALKPATSPLDALQRMEPGAGVRSAIASRYATRVLEVRNKGQKR